MIFPFNELIAVSFAEMKFNSSGYFPKAPNHQTSGDHVSVCTKERRTYGVSHVPKCIKIFLQKNNSPVFSPEVYTFI